MLAQITWELKVAKLDEKRCKLTCRALSETANEAFVTKLREATKGVPAEKSALQLHINEETPLFGKDIERKALAGVWP